MLFLKSLWKELVESVWGQMFILALMLNNTLKQVSSVIGTAPAGANFPSISVIIAGIVGVELAILIRWPFMRRWVGESRFLFLAKAALVVGIMAATFAGGLAFQAGIGWTHPAAVYGACFSGGFLLGAGFAHTGLWLAAKAISFLSSQLRQLARA